MKMTSLHQVLLSILTGLLLTLAFPYTGSMFFLSFIALIPLFLVEHKIALDKDKSWKMFLLALLSFLLYNSGANYWLYYSKTIKALPIVAHLINALFMAFFFMIYHWSKRKINTKYSSYTTIIFAVVWIAFEYIHYNWELSTPWLTFGNIFAISPQIVQWYSLTGALGGTLWILIINLLLFVAIKNILFEQKAAKSQIKLFLMAGLTLLIPSVLSIWTYTSYQEQKRPIEVVVTQPNTEQYVERKTVELKYQLDKLLDVANPLVTEKTAVVIGPETVIPNHSPINEKAYHVDSAFLYLQYHVNQWAGADLYMGTASYRNFDKKLRPSIKPYSTGKGFFEVYDSSILMKAKESPQFVHKAKLVLAAEKIPYSYLFPTFEKFARDIRGTIGTIGSGDKPEVLRSKGFNFAPINCYETIYGEWVAGSCKKGAEVIFAVTNDGWWGNSAGYKQHNSFSRLRAIENRRYVARSSMTGISCVINQRGDIIQSLDYNVHDAFKETLQLNKAQTFYTKNGDYIGEFAVFMFYLVLAFNILIIGKNFLAKRQKK